MRPAVAERHWRLESVLHPGARPWSQMAVLGGLTAICIAVLAALLATAFISDVGRGKAPAGWGTTVIYPSSAGDSPPRPVSPGQPARRTQPRTVTLQLSDLPPGARFGREGPASFSPSAQPPPSWDVVIRPDPAQPADYESAESLAVVYASDRVAASAMASLAASERAGGATEVAVTTRVGDRQTVWLEQSSSRPGVTIVRVAWQSMNVVGEVGIQAHIGQPGVERAMQLALVEQGRIGAPVSFDEPA
ncbi:hypothetical protein [Candidatus Nephthysia bennettiae]|uniref:Uncharacterized protein n=1 Tax=Candidatus Nephthysia bennettiae TaxID=3127016 RepID=A0A934JYN0_9BACT|nr:hypothetical protein [Candidatus Dormibacteraeota bacterium]MBJ7613063.1 hypothetical protein [Candidatus Dormibacteraeota bacterium]